jgi:methylated-DNA-[protein]-cysteine S-methyltransferase
MHRSCAPCDSPIGRLWVTVSEAGLVSISRRDVPPPATVLDPDAAADVVDELAAYFAGRLRTFSVPLDLADATPFDADVWTAARAIPFGETASYGELAIMAGRPGAARAVGGAMARCPFSPVVPCHRVIHADGTIGGWGSEPWVKRWLLRHEGAAAVRIHTR